jgi:hypothetical protein
MNKSKFIENIWITFSYNSMFCVGKTIISDGMKIVAAVSDSGDIKYVHYERIDNVKQLKILKDVKFNDYKSDKRDVDFDTNSN